MGINETKVCFLSENKINGNLTVQFSPITNPLEQVWQAFEPIFDTDTTGREIFNKIAQHPELRYIFNNVNYCRYMNSPDGELHYNINRIKGYYHNQVLSVLKAYTKERMIAYCLNLKQEELKLDPTVLAVSHRRMGWEYPIHKLNDNFSVYYKTNFGYGNSSYFYTILQYKNVMVVPYSDWIRYRYVDKYEIIRYSAAHQVSNESWAFAMEYTKDAWNLANQNEAAFVNRYLICQCDEMVDGLAAFMSGHTFKMYTKTWGLLTKANEMREEIQLQGHELMIFRAEKISGALNFIESIQNLKGIISIQGTIDKIEKYNLQIKPLIEIELPKIKKAILKETAERNRLKRVHDEAYELNKEGAAFYEQLREQHQEEEVEEFKKRFDAMHPKYILAAERSSQTYSDYAKAYGKLVQSERIEEHLSKSLSAINIYFTSKEELTDTSN